jgi:CubicO group peptidase (beta-lactamase class C family)
MRKVIVVAALIMVLAGCTSSNDSAGSATGPGQPGSGASIDPAKADAVAKVVRDMMATEHLKAVLLRVTIDGQDLITQAFGESMTGVPANTDMHFRNGAVAISYMSTLLLQLVDEKKVSLDDKVSPWLPDIPHTDRVTLGQLAQMTSGYVDFEQAPAFTAANYAQPFKQ